MINYSINYSIKKIKKIRQATGVHVIAKGGCFENQIILNKLSESQNNHLKGIV